MADVDLRPKQNEWDQSSELGLAQLQALNGVVNRHAIISMTDNAGRITYVNDKFCEISGYTREELLGQSHRIIKSNAHTHTFFRNMWRTISQGRTWNGVIENRTKDGSPYWVQTTITPVCDAHGKPQQYISVRTEISERRRMVQALEMLSVAEPGDNVFMDIARAVSEFLGNRWTGIGRIDTDVNSIEIIGFWNDGHPGEPFYYSLAGTPCADVCDRAHPLCVEEQVAEQYPEDTMLGDLGAVSYRGEPLLDQMGKEIGVLWVIDDKPCRDLDTERAFLRVAAKRASLELQRRVSDQLLADRNEFLFDTLERISDGFISLDRDWNFTFVNSSAARMFGANWYQLKGRCIWDVLPEVTSFFYKPLHKAMEDQESQRVEGFYPPFDTWMDVHVYPSNIGISVYLQDISERKKLMWERHEMDLRTQRSQKMEAIGQLAAGIAHDFNNILASIMGYTDLALSRCADDEQDKLTSYLNMVYQASERGRDLVLQMLRFSRVGSEEEPSPIDPLPLVKETIKLLQSTLPASISIHLDAPSQAVPAIAATAVQIQQVVMNLCVNARDAMHGKGRLSLNLENVSSAVITCDSCQEMAEGDFVELAISDTGEGIEPHLLEKLFEPFYTTKEVGQGTGLGLSVVHGIVHDLGGHITVKSTPGKGSTFRLLFPAVHIGEDVSQGVIAVSHCLPTTSPVAGGRILLVDDEPALLGFVEELLASEGFEVNAHSDSTQAISDFQQDPRRFDLVITDQSMPGLTGTELANELRALNAHIPILLCSGYGGGLNLDSLSKQGPCSFLPKPYDRVTLLTRIGDLLNVRRNKDGLS